MTKVLWIVILFLTLVIIVLTLILFASPAEAPTTPVGSAGGQATGSVPEALHDRVIVASPKPDATVDRDFKMIGEAPGNWYFEASFPYKIIAPNGDPLANLYCQAQSEWMTTEQVPFVCNVQIASDYAGPATVVLMKDNPSGLPEHDDSIDFQVIIK